MRPASRTGSRPLTSSTPMLSRPTFGRSRWNSTRAIALPITAMSSRCSASAPIEAPRSSTMDSPLSVGQIAAIAGRSMPAIIRRLNLRHRHQRAGVAGRHGDVGLALLHRVDGEPHRRLPAAVAQRLARLVVHPDRDVGVHHPGGGLEPRMGVEQRVDLGPVAEQDERAVGVLRPAQRSAPGTTTEGP